MSDTSSLEFDEFSDNVQRLYQRMSPCRLCPRECLVRRDQGQTGYCGIGSKPRISSVGPHFGEESCLVGQTGSGTIFFAGCNLSCVYCQNYDISQQRSGRETGVEAIADAMLELQRLGCCNINFVTPTHVAAPIAAAVERARTNGLTLPTVYNCGGYDSVDTLKLLEPFVDIYMPDIKYADASISGRLSDATDYPSIAFAAVKEMHRQKGDLVLENGVAKNGLLVRHLVLPGGLSGSDEVVDFLYKEISPDTYVNIMDQYRPCYKADTYPELNQFPSSDEINRVRLYAKQKGLRLAD